MKMKLVKNIIGIFIVVLLTILPKGEAQYSINERLSGWKQQAIGIESNGKISIINAYIADTQSKRKRGLMHVENMPEDAGMLFVFDPPRTVSMWMKNTLIELDIIFIDQDQKVIKIHKNAQPHNLESISSELAVKWVVEINGKASDLWEIKPGGQLIFQQAD